MTRTTSKQACVFGGTGFIGRQIVRLLAKDGYTVKVVTRVPAAAYFLKTAGQVGQIVPVSFDSGDEEGLREAVRGCSVAVNCVGILYEKKRGDFAHIHTEFPRRLAKACRSEGVERLIHISALGCNDSDSIYGKTKYAGERAVLENFTKATILRPSVVFGPEDNFFNMFARLSVVLPALPLIGGGHTRFQPVYVCDVAESVMAALHSEETMGKVYALGGPEILTFRQIYEKMFSYTGRRRCLVTVPWSIAYAQGAILGLLPTPVLTSDQVSSLKTDTIVGPGELSLRDLGINPTALDSILPTYLSRYRAGGRFAAKKRP